jgi:hypothetical protein
VNAGHAEQNLNGESTWTVAGGLAAGAGPRERRGGPCGGFRAVLPEATCR